MHFIKSEVSENATEIAISFDHSYAATNVVSRGKLPCPICKKCFFNKHQLRVHMRVHTNNRPYSCTCCEKTFKQRSHLEQHLRTHTNERPYECAFLGCSKKFKQHSQLEQHMRVHLNETPYTCTICAQKFRQQNQIDMHLRKIHNAPKSSEETSKKSLSASKFSLKHSIYKKDKQRNKVGLSKKFRLY